MNRIRCLLKPLKTTFKFARSDRARILRYLVWQ